jgi:hypothetical protein
MHQTTGREGEEVLIFSATVPRLFDKFSKRVEHTLCDILYTQHKSSKESDFNRSNLDLQ